MERLCLVSENSQSIQAILSATCETDFPVEIRRIILLALQTPTKTLPPQAGQFYLLWNARVNEALDAHDDLRTAVLIRNMQTREFVLFEEETHRFVPDDFRWEYNKRGNLQGYDAMTGEHRFTWQPHGSQFTIIRPVPGSARRFSIVPNVPMMEVEAVLKQVGFKLDWIRIGS